VDSDESSTGWDDDLLLTAAPLDGDSHHRTPGVSTAMVMMNIRFRRHSDVTRSERRSRMPRRPNVVRARLDDVDRRLLADLLADGRTPNVALAQRAGIAPSTCLARVQALRDSGTLRGIHADVDLAAVGRPLQAMIAVRLRAHEREQVELFRRTAPRIPGVLSMFHVSGGDDYLLHVAVADSDALRDFVLEHLTGHPAVGHTETSLIFEHVRGSAALISRADDDRVTRAR
jgi:DNA-binding Lrp family transcriptional regulator